MNKVDRISHKGKTIYLCSYTGTVGDELLQQIEIFEKGLLKLSNNGLYKLLILQDATDTVMDSAAVDRWKKAGAAVKPAIKKQAVIGITGIRKVLVSAITSFSGIQAELFNTKEEALDWLAED